MVFFIHFWLRLDIKGVLEQLSSFTFVIHIMHQKMMHKLAPKPVKHARYDIRKLAAQNIFTDFKQLHKHILKLGELSILNVTLE